MVLTGTYALIKKSENFFFSEKLSNAQFLKSNVGHTFKELQFLFCLHNFNGFTSSWQVSVQLSGVSLISKYVCYWSSAGIGSKTCTVKQLVSVTWKTT